MKKITSDQAFFKVNKTHIKEIGLEGALLLAYINEFEEQGKECFASRDYIAGELGISQTTLHRLFKKLKTSGHITITRHGNRRILHVVRVFKLNRQGVQNEQPRVFKMNSQGVQNEHIQRNKLQINKFNKETNYKELRNERAGRGSLKKEFFISDQETEAEKAAYLAFKRSLLGK